MLLRSIHIDLHLRHPMTHCSIKPQHTCNFLTHILKTGGIIVLYRVLGKLWQCNLQLFFSK